MEVVPLFKSHHSISKSILTLGEYQKPQLTEDGFPEEQVVSPDSAIQICKDAGLSEVVLVEDSMGGFMEAYTNCKSAGLKLIFGFRVTFVNDVDEDIEGALPSWHKNVIFANNTAGYKRLIKIYTQASVDLAQKGVARLDYGKVKTHWSEDLTLAVPFYDSFIHQNNFTLSSCVPTFDFTKPAFFVEDNNLPFDKMLRQKVRQYAGSEYEVIPAKTIYYKNCGDFRAWQVFKCMQKSYGRARTLEMPNMDHCCSDEFSFESWQKIKNDCQRFN